MNTVIQQLVVAVAIGLVGLAAMAADGGGGTVIAGPLNAPLTIEEYADFQCPYCAKGSKLMKQVLQDFPDKVKLVFRNVPLPMHNNSKDVAKAFVAVALQNPSVAYQFQADLFANQEKLAEPGEPFAFEEAARLGIDVARMKADMASNQVANIWPKIKEAATTHDFGGTPSFIIGTESVQGCRHYDEIKKIIEGQLKAQLKAATDIQLHLPLNK